MDKLFVLTLAFVVLTATAQALSNDNIDISVDVDSDSKAYHQFKTREGSFNYGYNVAKQHFNQFQHKVRGPDDVTYGCYGFVDPKNGTHLYHYVSDLKGYRVVPPNKPTKIYRQRVAESVKQLLEAVEENLPWERLYFPEVCRYLYLSHKQSNKFVLPPDLVINDDGTVTKEADKPSQVPLEVPPRPAPAKPADAKITPDASQQRATTASRPTPPRAPAQYSPPAAPVTFAPPVRQTTRPTTTTPRPTVASRTPAFVNSQPQGGSVTPVRVAPAPTPRPTPAPAPAPTLPPKRISNDITGQPSKIVAKPIESRPVPKPSLAVRRPNEPQATTYTETVLPSGYIKPENCALNSVAVH
ncbi:AAEL011028-PB [Aedes aegypti]|uniref:AAEL011028-PA n=1 Tax=Aedes aegypti TaxID=7159 RepID=Q16R95_AEDAE|nr:AAEL011028-PA [Aedes aegypti]EJY57895.1 AAEL011028-PB [Aedes aegypti]